MDKKLEIVNYNVVCETFDKTVSDSSTAIQVTVRFDINNGSSSDAHCISALIKKCLATYQNNMNADIDEPSE